MKITWPFFSILGSLLLSVLSLLKIYHTHYYTLQYSTTSFRI